MEKQVLVKKTLKCVCAAALMVAILAAQHDSLVRVKAEDKLVITAAKNVGAKLVHEIREGRRGPLYAGYFRSWHDSASTGLDGKQHHPENTIAEIPKEVDILFVFPDHTAPESPFWSKLKDGYVHKLHEQGTVLVQTIGVNELNGRTGLSTDFPDSPEGHKALAKAIVKKFVTDRGVDGLDIDVERDFEKPRTEAEDLRALNVFKEIAKIIGKNGLDTSKFLIMDTTLSVDKNPIFKGVASDIDFLLRQYYGPQGGNEEVDIINSEWLQYQKFIDASQFMIGFSFFEESAPKGNLWFDVNEYDPNNPDKGKDIDGTRAKKYAEWQPSTGGLKAGIFSYAIDRDGVAHVPSAYKNRIDSSQRHPVVDNISHTDYTVSRKLKNLMTKDIRYGLIDQQDIPDAALRAEVIKQVGQYKGDLERYNQSLILTDENIKNLEGLNRLKKLQKLELHNLSKVKEITPSLLPESMKQDAELLITGLTGLERLDLRGLNRQTLEGISADGLVSLKAFDLSHNSLDLSEQSADRDILITLMQQVKKKNHQGYSENTAFENQKPKGYYPKEYETKEAHYDVDYREHDILRDFVFGTVTKRNTFIGDSSDFEDYKKGTIDGRQYVAKDYTYEAFHKDYKGYKVHLTASNLGETETARLKAYRDETYSVVVSNGEKTVHTMTINIGIGAPIMENLAKDAKVIGTSYNSKDVNELANKVFDGFYQNSFRTWDPTNWIVFEIEKPVLIKEWRLFNGETNPQFRRSSDNVSQGRLQVLKDTSIDLMSLNSDDLNNYLKDEQNWQTVSEITSAQKIYNGIVGNVSSRYWRFCVDSPNTSYTELQILGYRLPLVH